MCRRLDCVAQRHPGEIIMYRQHGEHIHVIHDCVYLSRRCRCRLRFDPVISPCLKKSQRRTRAITVISDIDWLNVLLYFFVSKGPGRGKVWLRGADRRLTGVSEIIQWQNSVAGSLAILEGQGGGHASECEQEHKNNAVSKHPHSRRQRIPTGKWCGPSIAAKKILSLLMSSNCIPPENITNVIPICHPFYMHLIDPKFKRYFEMGLQLYKKTVNDLDLKGLEKILCSGSENDVFYANCDTTWDYYNTLGDSVAWLNRLLLFQSGGDTDKAPEFLTNIVSWFKKKGLYQWTEIDNNEVYIPNKKPNTLCVVGTPNSGKNWFFDCIISLALNVGHIGRCNNKTNQFAMQDVVDRRIVVGKEISIEDGALEDFKKVCEGIACNIRVKYKGDAILRRTPVFLISNSQLIVCSHPHFKDIRAKTIRWSKYDELKNAAKKPYPLAFLEVLQMYDVSY
ncbi:uncharacterized protein LOC124796394 [Schistocerca piceifrons]|uniref:uncharacterized protein LOC124796394 n=1 Tax=Schistocerca piceifrons TaxID=274613 RepID=UPI001F5F06FC|nr:uncharacterized protein LOC124796394 [Schistocerca piceifrons]